jgi:hypothetical protein
MEIIQTMKKYDSYKDFSIERIGEIPSYWNIKEFNFIKELIY